MTKPNGIHHLAISTGNIKAQIEFFTDVLGCELVALYWMHGADGYWHGFLKLNDHSYVAFVESPGIRTIEPIDGVTHAGNGAGTSAPGTMQHVAFNVDTYEELQNIQWRIRSRGINVMGPIHHGMCDSIYFAGPEGLTLEVATSEKAINAHNWIDPEVVALAGITPEELERFKRPARFERPDAPIPNPPIDWTKPHMRYPKPVYEALMSMDDDAIAARASVTEPPVR